MTSKPKLKSSKAETEQRIHAVYMLLLRRETTPTICNFVQTKWGVSDAQARRYLQAARDRMVEEAKADRAEARAEHLAIRRDLFGKLYKDSKWGAAFQVVQDEAKLLGLYFNLEDHLQAALSAGYNVYEPGSPEDQAANQAAAEGFECEIEIGLASPPEGGVPMPEAV